MSSNEEKFPYSVKIEQSAKGARVTVHVNGVDGSTVQGEAVKLYKATREALANAGQTVAPDENK